MANKDLVGTAHPGLAEKNKYMVEMMKPGDTALVMVASSST